MNASFTATNFRTWSTRRKESSSFTSPPPFQKTKVVFLSFQASSSPIAKCILAQTSTQSIKISGENEPWGKSLKDKSVPNTRPKTVNNKGKDPKKLNSSAAERSNLDYFQVLKYPLATETSLESIIKHNTLVFIVDKYADKKNIKEAVNRMLKVTARRVNTLMTPDGNKKAYITLVPECSALDLAKEINIL